MKKVVSSEKDVEAHISVWSQLQRKEGGRQEHQDRVLALCTQNAAKTYLPTYILKREPVYGGRETPEHHHQRRNGFERRLTFEDGQDHG